MKRWNTVLPFLVCLMQIMQTPPMQAQAAPNTSASISPSHTDTVKTSKAPAATSEEIPFKEDWSTLSAEKSGLPEEYAGGMVMMSGDTPGSCSTQVMRVQWRPSDPIDLYVIRPEGIEKPPAAIFLLNYTFDSAVFRNSFWCGQASQNHIAIIGFGSALSPQRFHSPRPLRQWFVSEFQEALATSVHDVQRVITYLAKRKDLDMEHVGIYGQGSGGAVAILAAATDPRLSAVEVSDPWGDWPVWIKGSLQIPEEERATYLRPDFLATIAPMDPIDYLPKLQGKALRVRQVMNDLVTPATAKDAIAAALPHKEDLIRYPDAASQHRAVLSDGFADWLSLHLQTTTATAKK